MRVREGGGGGGGFEVYLSTLRAKVKVDKYNGFFVMKFMILHAFVTMLMIVNVILSCPFEEREASWGY